MEILPMLADAVTLIGHASYLASLKRREFLKPDITSAYQSVVNLIQSLNFYSEMNCLSMSRILTKWIRFQGRPWLGLVHLGVIYLNIRAITISSLDGVETINWWWNCYAEKQGAIKEVSSCSMSFFQSYFSTQYASGYQLETFECQFCSENSSQTEEHQHGFDPFPWGLFGSSWP